MVYFIDGYNLIFSLIDSKESLQILRQKVIHLLQKKFAHLNLTGLLVFDGAHRRDEESGLSYPSPLVVAYTPKGQSADEYILEQIEGSSRRALITVVTNDRGLGMHAKSMGAKVQSNSAFIHWLKGKVQKVRKKEIEPADTKQNIERLLKIFEDKLKKKLEDS